MHHPLFHCVYFQMYFDLKNYQLFLLSSSLLGVLAQRLVRKLCESCKEEDILGEKFIEEFSLSSDTKIFKACGCKECNFTGYSGRVAIGELFIVDDHIKNHLHNVIDDNTLMDLAVKNGMIPLSAQIKEMLIQGTTSLDEAVRIGIK